MVSMRIVIVTTFAFFLASCASTSQSRYVPIGETKVHLEGLEGPLGAANGALGVVGGTVLGVASLFAPMGG